MPPSRGHPLSLADRARCHLQQRAIAALSFPGVTLGTLLFNPLPPAASPAAVECTWRRYRELLDRDLDNVERGYYPRDLLFQFPFWDYLARAPEALPDLPGMVLRKHRGAFDDLPLAADPRRYPRYYRRTFHWQTDGWFSLHSARLYDPGVESLFLGTADVMRRQTLPPLVDGLRKTPRPRVLDIATGTGRLLSMLHRAVPSARLTGLDMSPYYIDYARDHLRHIPDLRLQAANAERTGLPSGRFDALSSIYLFHELPRDARRRVLREARRLLRPGGHLVVMDSAQPSDSPALEEVLRLFPRLAHEPYYKDYLRDTLEEAVEECGFRVERTEPHFVSKLVVAVKES